MAVTRNLPDENSTPPVSGADYVADVADTVEALWDAVALVPTSVTDSGNDYTIEVSPALDADVKEGMVFYVEPSASATGSARMRVTDSNPYYDLVKANGDALGSGDFDTGTVYVVLFFDGTFRIVSGAADGGGGGAEVTREVFTSSGTWNKPSEGTVALIEVWGAGGGGGFISTAGNGGAGGGGGYSRVVLPLSALGSSETVTVGAGGTGASGSTGPGTAGGNSSFGSHVTGYGGGAGTDDGGGGGGGGQLSAGADGTSSGGDGGDPAGGPGGNPGTSLNSGGGGDAGGGTGGDGILGGGGGSGDEGTGGDSLYGGAGGGATGGTSAFGGDGGNSGTAGSAPGGGGGDEDSGSDSAGDGARGEVRVTVW